MAGEVDLHIHSDRSSDGEFSPAEIIRLAEKAHLKAIAIADHDTVGAYPEAMELAVGSQVEVIPSLEMTTLFDGREFHLLLPFMDWENQALLELINRVHQARIEEARERVARLQELGFDFSWEDVVKERKSNPPLGVVLARLLLKKNSSRSDPRLTKYYENQNVMRAPYMFYEDYFREGKPAYVPKRTPSLIEVLERTSELGAVPVLAHPGADFELASREDLLTLKRHGLQGLEVFSTYHDPEQTSFYWQIAKELDLVPTAGSDFHGRIKPYVAFGSVKEGGYWMVEALQARRAGGKKWA